MELAGDHVEPAVSIATSPDAEQRGLKVYARVGNRARIVSGTPGGSRAG